MNSPDQSSTRFGKDADSSFNETGFLACSTPSSKISKYNLPVQESLKLRPILEEAGDSLGEESFFNSNNTTVVSMSKINISFCGEPDKSGLLGHDASAECNVLSDINAVKPLKNEIPHDVSSKYNEEIKKSDGDNNNFIRLNNNEINEKDGILHKSCREFLNSEVFEEVRKMKKSFTESDVIQFQALVNNFIFNKKISSESCNLNRVNSTNAIVSKDSGDKVDSDLTGEAGIASINISLQKDIQKDSDNVGDNANDTGIESSEVTLKNDSSAFDIKLSSCVSQIDKSAFKIDECKIVLNDIMKNSGSPNKVIHKAAINYPCKVNASPSAKCSVSSEKENVVLSADKSIDAVELKVKIGSSDCNGKIPTSNNCSHLTPSVNEAKSKFDTIANDEVNVTVTEEDIYFSNQDKINICFDSMIKQTFIVIDKTNCECSIKDDEIKCETAPKDATLKPQDDIPEFSVIKWSEIGQKPSVAAPPPLKKPCLETQSVVKDRPLEVFVSNNSSENVDNNNPHWQKFKQLTSDEQRYEAVRTIWKNPCIPNANINLSTYNWRARNKLSPLSLYTNNTGRYYLTEGGDVRKIFNKYRENANFMIEEKIRILEETRDALLTEAENRLYCDSYRTDGQWRRQFYDEFHRQSDAINSEVEYEIQQLRSSLRQRITALNSAEREVTTVNNFYKGLDGEGELSRTRLTPRQLSCWYEREDILNEYEVYYSEDQEKLF